MTSTPLARTQVAIIGAGPAGLVLAHLLHLQGIDSVVLEQRSRAHIETRVRAGMLEAPTVELLREIGVAGRLDREAHPHRGFFIRFDGAAHFLDVERHTGRHPMIYGQQEVVKDLIAARLATGRAVHFEAQDVRIDGISSDSPTVAWHDADGHHELRADYIAGCDGFHGITRQSLPAGAISVAQREYPFSWLGILARSKLLAEQPTYCAHEDGFSLHSMRGGGLTRQYLQVPVDVDLTDWPDERIWAELRHRSTCDGEEPLESGEILERIVAPLRSAVFSPMQHGRVFLLGDAAHIVPPTGAKGLNLAVSDASVLSHALGAFYAGAGSHYIDSYTVIAQPRVWQAELFSWNHTHLLHRMSDDPFDRGIQRASLQQLVSSETAQRLVSEVYTGLPFPTPWRWR